MCAGVGPVPVPAVQVKGRWSSSQSLVEMMKRAESVSLPATPTNQVVVILYQNLAGVRTGLERDDVRDTVDLQDITLVHAHRDAEIPILVLVLQDAEILVPILQDAEILVPILRDAEIPIPDTETLVPDHDQDLEIAPARDLIVPPVKRERSTEGNRQGREKI